MANIIYGMKCPLCGKPMEEGQPLVAFPPFVGNELNPLWFFNDAAFHADCFETHPLAAKALARSEEAISESRPEKRVCFICGRRIDNMADYFGIPHLVDDARHPLFRYNYTQAHLSCLRDWPDRSHLHELLEDLNRSGEWRGRTLDYILRDLESLR